MLAWIISTARYAAVISEAARQVGAKVIVFSHSALGKSTAYRVAVRMNAGSVSGVNACLRAMAAPSRPEGRFFRQSLCKVRAEVRCKSTLLMGNSIPVVAAAAWWVEELKLEIPPARVTVKKLERVEGISPCRKQNWSFLPAGQA